MKRWTGLFCALLLFMAFLTPVRPSAAAGTGGDVDGDGLVTAADAAAILRAAAGKLPLDASGTAAADVTGNQSVTRADAQAVLMHVTGSLNAFSDLAGAIETGLLGENELSRFSYTGAVQTENGYRDSRVSVRISTVEFHDSVCYVADIYLRDITCLRTAFSSGEFRGQREYVDTIAADNAAYIALTGDMYTRNADGAIVRNGTWYDGESVTKKKDLCVLYRDGAMETFAAGTMDYDALNASGDIYQLWAFGPRLLDENSEPMTEFRCSSSILTTNPRSAIGYFSPGHYCFVLVDGRQRPYSVGLTMEDLSEFMYGLGCTSAYNLDGGQSAMMATAERVINRADKGGRKVTDIVYIGAPLA